MLGFFSPDKVGKNFPGELTAKVTVICRLSSTPFVGTFFNPLKLKVYCPGDAEDKGVWSMFKTRKFRISWLDIAVDIVRWKVNFSSARNWGEGSVLPVVPFRLEQFKSDRTFLAYWFVSSTVPPNSFRMLGLFALTTPFVTFTIYLLLITSSAWRVPIAMSLTFLIRLSFGRFGLPTFLKTKLSPPVLHLFFQLFTEVLINVNFGYFTENFLMADDVPNVNAWFPTSLLTFSGISFWYFFGLPYDLLISFTAKDNSAFMISFVARETTFVTVISSVFSVFLSFLKNSEETDLCSFR